ncbi:MAG TPA: adenosylcobinamide-GDP ribazoletransferase [Candidatus Binatia bacterium]
MSTFVRRLALALSFLTRLPLARIAGDEVDVGRAVAFFPLVGVVLGTIVAGVAWLLADRLPASVLAVLLVALIAALTGGLHLDGLADTFDALGASGDAERRLAVLRDSRIGAHGASALLLLVLAKVAALEAHVASGGLAPLVVFPALARAVVPLELVSFSYARPSGLGSAFRAHAKTSDVALALATAAAALLFLGFRGVLAGVATVLLALLFARLAARRFGGLTGDVYGASIELAEALFLVLTLRAP